MDRNKQILVVFRYDDYSGVSPIDVDGKLIETLAKNRFSCTFGVTPFITTGEYRDPRPRGCVPLDGLKAKMLRDGVIQGTVDVALHGYDHRSIYAAPPYSEFMGLRYSAQLEKISEGKNIIESTCGTQVSVFIPPWNTYDLNTLKALQEVGIRCISANRYGVADYKGSIAYVPITVELEYLRKALDEARESEDTRPIVAVLMHPYDFQESKDRRAKFSALSLDAELAWLSSQPDVKVVSVTALCSSGENVGSGRYLANAPFLLEDAAPESIRCTEARTIYLSLKEAKRIRRSNEMRLALFFFIVFGVSAVLGHIGNKNLAGLFRPEPWKSIAEYLVLMALAFSAFRAVVKRNIHFRGLLLLVVCLGLLLGYLSA